MYAQELYLLQVKSTPSRYGISMTSTQSTQAPYTNTPNTQNGPKTHADPPTPPSQSPNATFAYTNDILRCFERSTVSSGLLEAKAELAIADRDLYGEERSWQMAQSIPNRSAAGPQEQVQNG
jgi:hypothetical protein